MEINEKQLLQEIGKLHVQVEVYRNELVKKESEIKQLKSDMEKLTSLLPSDAEGELDNEGSES